ncbi:MAG: glycoside hydrolase family 99-like domain-containing protein [Syntrophobacteraceae bacterium]
MFQVRTDFPVAMDSPDHRLPVGTRIDNNTDRKLIEEMDAFFLGEKVYALDLGCSGGQFIVDLANRGHKAIGIEGSNYSVVHGRANWPKYHNSVLFTADICKPFQILDDNRQVRFDSITAWEVLEHLAPEDLDRVLSQIAGLLSDGGIFWGSIATVECIINGVRLHQSVYPMETWLSRILSMHFTVVSYPFKSAVNELWIKVGESFPFACKKKITRKLNLGCGGNRLPGWENRDDDLDISKPLPIRTESYDFILAEHVIEHIPVDKAYMFLEECFRVLKPGGVARFCIPGVDKIYRNFTDGYGEFLKCAGFADGTLRDAVKAMLTRHGHEAAWTQELLFIFLLVIGFLPQVSKPRYSLFPELQDIDGHWKVIGEENNLSETIVVDAVKSKEIMLSNPRSRPSCRKQIGIGLIEHLGDIVACEPVARYLKQQFPDADITWVVNERYRELVDYNPHIDRVLSVNCLSDWMRACESDLFDEIVDLHVNKRVCTIWGKVLNKKRGNPAVDVVDYFKFGSLLGAFSHGAGLPALDMSPRVYIPEEVQRKVDLIGLPRQFIVIHCTSNEINKDWPVSKWFELVKAISGKWGMPTVEVGLVPVCSKLNGQNSCIDLCGRLSILETAEVIRRSILFIGVDSGPAHIANALGIPGVILMGRYRIYHYYMPFTGEYANGINADIIFNRDGCARDIPVEEVLSAVKRRMPRDRHVAAAGKPLEDTGIYKAASTKLLAFYLPQFHPIPENDAWWGKGFTEWTNVAKARPLFEGHYQPHIPSDLGFYDLRIADTRKAQADLAKEYGIYGFCYYHYWFNGRRLLELPFAEVLASGEPDFPFCLCWANENWTRAWDGQHKDVLTEQTYSEEDDRTHIRWLLDAFRDKRYIRINNRPLLLIYSATKHPNARRMTQIWREEACRKSEELYLCKVESFPEEHSHPKLSGFDASIEFQPEWGNFFTSTVLPNGHMVFDYPALVQRMISKPVPPYKRYPCVTPMWDNSARRKTSSVILHNSSPEQYQKWLGAVIGKLDTLNLDERIVFINGWNEWGEGNHLEPDARHGRGYLEATRMALFREGAPGSLPRSS